MVEPTSYYFGCGTESGHYLFSDTRGRQSNRSDPLIHKLSHMDGVLPPLSEKYLYRASVSRLGGIGFSALSWWDRSVDKRPGSNSTVFIPWPDMPADDLIDYAASRFPWVFKRLPTPLTLWDGPQP